MSTPVVLITGAAGGLGRALAQRFAQSRWRVAAADRDAEGLHGLNGIVGLDSSVTADLSSAEGCRNLVSKVMARTGRLDALINAAGIWREGEVETFSEEDYDLVMAVNLKSTFFMCSAAIPFLKENRGVIINVASGAGRQPIAGAAAYGAAKAAVRFFSQNLAVELARDGVRVNAVSPGDIDTPMLDFQAARYGSGDPAGYRRNLLNRYPQGDTARFIQPEEVAEFVYFLCQPQAAAISGADLPIDFGLSAGR
ncbi:short-chain dehydrogenase [Pseudomonas oryzihabitans]|uniref:SDR family NAD(P)-dependent oxidoreductase n=1 Tax=Pseudomonas rhizoryzae TaxID=2571129 RepID=UPI0007371DB7|nr:SDR family oxidoreductase [Pseudomonas rhizoryzae]KTS79733.1 short-chain dehydrogenase [Pseudomonas psychrotolerans]KTT12812.1 short-chain dehydrogenase [Pseudomonas psychrotolerans]KTT31424.1 short-chain dehydrogenase [Pseudomonas psychrotolerans]KTT31725.1 short-chain dehydrogenase [Pseudomonas psychrotolerans]KTT40373.1 short-chain dehydrogenase [Pseudomonas psychrotolerans]